MAVALSGLLHTSTYMRQVFLRLESATNVRSELRVYSTDEVDDAIAGFQGTDISDFVRSILNLPDAQSVRVALDVYARSETYNNTETYNTSQVYTKTETESVVSNAVSQITALSGLTSGVVSVNGHTGIVNLVITDIPVLQSSLDGKASTSSVATQVNAVYASITSNVATVNAAISAQNTTLTGQIATKANAASLGGYTTVTAYTALSSRVDGQATSISLDEDRITTLEQSGPKLPVSRTVANASATTLTNNDAGSMVLCNGLATINLNDAITTNNWGFIVRGGAAVTIAGSVTIRSPLNLTTIADQYGMVMWWKRQAGVFYLSGDLG